MTSLARSPAQVVLEHASVVRLIYFAGPQDEPDASYAPTMSPGQRWTEGPFAPVPSPVGTLLDGASPTSQAPALLHCSWSERPAARRPIRERRSWTAPGRRLPSQG